MHVCCIYIRVYRRIYNDDSRIVRDKILYPDMPLGISYISSSLKQAGHTTELLYCTYHSYNQRFYEHIKKEPQVIAISVTTFIDFDIAIKISSALKNKFKKAKIIVGGQLVTMDTENVFLKLKDIDALCIGAGEKAIVEYVSQVEKGAYKKTDNLWIKTDNDVLKCDKVLSIENLDELPFPDREGWENIALFPRKQTISLNRGCIYNCIFCTNTIIQKKTNNRCFRTRSVDSVIKEVDYVYKRYRVKEIGFIAENALADKEIFRSLCLALKEYNSKLEEKIGFYACINFTPNLLCEDRDIINLIKEANFVWLNFSIESGSFEMRQKLQKPTFTNEQIIQFCNILKERNINVLCYALYCFPYETKETYLKTVECLKKCRPAKIIYQVLKGTPGTKLYYDLQKEKTRKFNLIDMYRYFTFEWRVYKTYKPIVEIIDIFFPTIKYLYIRAIYSFFKDTVEKYFQLKKIKNIKMGKKNFDIKKYDKAIKYFNKVAISSDNYWIYGDRAIAKMYIGDYKGAIEDFDKALKSEDKEVYKQKRQECLNILNMK